MASFFVIQGRDQGTRYHLDADHIVVGRDAGCDIQLHDQEISRVHAEIVRNAGYLRIKDRQSSNGMFVNGCRVEQHLLRTGDRLQLGRTLLLYTGSPSAPDKSPSDSSVDVVPPDDAAPASRIVRALPQEEGYTSWQAASSNADAPWMARARSDLQVMYRTAMAISHTLDIGELLNHIMDFIFEWVEADRGCMLLQDASTEKLHPSVLRNRRGTPLEGTLAISQTILDYVMERNEGVLTSDARDDERWDSAASILQMGVREAICVPMMGRYNVVGVIYIDTWIPPEQALEGVTARRFSEEHLKLMNAIAHQAALAVEDTNYYSALVQAERLAAVGQAIAMLSHDVKNILQGIRGASYLIEQGLEKHDEDVVRNGWKMVQKNQEKILNLVMDMLSFSKDREPQYEAADLNEVVQDVVQLLESRTEDACIELQWKPADDLPACTFDPTAMHRAILNVVTNACDASQGRPDACVRISTAFDCEQRMLQIEVRDNGEGIPREDHEKLFSVFYSKKGSRGTGLGLPVSQKILQEHGGKIRVESTVGTGSGFILELPAVLSTRDVAKTMHLDHPGGNASDEAPPPA